MDDIKAKATAAERKMVVLTDAARGIAGAAGATGAAGTCKVKERQWNGSEKIKERQ